MKLPTPLIEVPNEIVEHVRRMHPDLKKKIKASLKTILSDFETGKGLKGDLIGLRSFRVGRLRIIYRISDKRKKVEVIAIGPRISIYEATFRNSIEVVLIYSRNNELTLGSLACLDCLLNPFDMQGKTD